MLEASNFYKSVRQFALSTRNWQDALRYQTLADERYDLYLAAYRVYGDDGEFLAIQAAAGLDSVEQGMDEQVLVLPTLEQLQLIKQATGYGITAV